MRLKREGFSRSKADLLRRIVRFRIDKRRPLLVRVRVGKNKIFRFCACIHEQQKQMLLEFLTGLIRVFIPKESSSRWRCSKKTDAQLSAK